MTWQVICADVLDGLASLPDASVQTVVTSPPYWGLRDYGNEGQLGLEPSPEAYVERMVEVFRAVRRVLRDDGTVWLNLGDSYAGSWGNQARKADRGTQRPINGEMLTPVHDGRYPDKGSNTGEVPPGLKPKDLVGIPWRVAFALQQPYYTGRIKSETDRVWLAAMVDAEGCLFIHKRKVGQSNGKGYARKAASFGAGMEVANTSEAIVQRCMAIAGGRGSITRQEKDRRQPLYRWSMRSNECREVVRELYPHLVAKQHQARLLLGCPSSGPQAEAAHQGLIELHGGGVPSVDFAAPAPMWEPGWYVRSDVIWSKLNPMPESVTDRPTKSHEYVFLLSRSARYFYDADAVRQPHAGQFHPSGRPWLEATEGIVLGRATNPNGGLAGEHGNPDGRNMRSVWNIATEPFPGAHFATFPKKLVEPCVKAGSATGDTVLDPFCGSGTVGLVSLRLGCSFVGIELNPEYAEMARERIRNDAPLWNHAAEVSATHTEESGRG